MQAQEASLKQRDLALLEKSAELSALKDTMAALERQLAGTQTATRKEAASLDAQLKQCQEALESERSHAGFLRQQLGSVEATLEHEKQLARQAQQQLHQVHLAPCACTPCKQQSAPSKAV